MKIVTVAQMVAMEKATDAAGFTYDQMMARAGGALAEVIGQRLRPMPEGHVVFLIGPGNNGGDGLVACARLLEMGVNCTAYIWRRKDDSDPLLAGIGEVQWAEEDPEHRNLVELLRKAAIVVDALLGTGNTRPISGSLASLMEVVHDTLVARRTHLPDLLDPLQPRGQGLPVVVACDCPSGLHCDTGAVDEHTVTADITVTFALPKAGHFLHPGGGACGELIIADIQIDRSLAPDDAPDLLTGDEIRQLLPDRPPFAHKGTFGKALIVAGSGNYPGAAAIACLAAYRVGAGLVRLAAPAVVGETTASLIPEPVHTLLPADLGAITSDAIPILTPLLMDQDSLLLGPGLSTERSTVDFVTALLQIKADKRRPIGFLGASDVTKQPQPSFPPMVVDADALNALALRNLSPSQLPPHSVLTPHPGEMSRLCDLPTATINADRWRIASQYAREWQQILILKGAFTVIAHPDGRLAINPFADPAMATAGSGDVLAGILVGLLAQGLGAWDAARLGVYLHALAGQQAHHDHGAILLASDIAQAVSKALSLLIP